MIKEAPGGDPKAKGRFKFNYHKSSRWKKEESDKPGRFRRDKGVIIDSQGHYAQLHAIIGKSDMKGRMHTRASNTGFPAQ